MTAITFGSVCSGIEAASLAFHPMGWRAAWLAEVDKFASAVLAHHYPTVPNLGDMTKIAKAVLLGTVPAPDVLCGGTPCQAFSLAGLRQSLADARGNLTLKFVELANAIDHVRAGAGKPAATIFWENVHGVLSTKDNAFGFFLAGLAGEDGALEPPEPRPEDGKSSKLWKWDKKLRKHVASWANAGCVYGPQRAIAWRTMDAQYTGVAQRRRRVFVVASARDGFDPATVLFEWDGLRRDTAPSREARQDIAPGIRASAGKRGGIQDQSGADGLIAGTLQANGKAAGSATQQDAECGLLIPIQAFGGNRTSGDIDIAPALLAQPGGSGYKNDFESETFLLQPTHSLRAEGFDASEDGTDRGTPLVPVAFDTTQITSRANGSNPQPGAPCHALAAGAKPPAIAFPANLSGTQHASAVDISPSLGAVNPTAVAHVDVMPTMTAGGPAKSSHNQTSGQMRDAYMVPTTNMGVRRLTPTECERLMGMPDGYTQIPWRGKPADQCPDGPRYKALGNSWVVPNITWIGQRIHNAIT